jgi:hypothetical protein
MNTVPALLEEPAAVIEEPAAATEPAGNAVVPATEAPPPALVEPEPTSLLPAIIRLARDPAVDVTKMEALLKMQERMEARQAESAFNTAFLAMQQKLPRIKKGGALTYPKNKNDPDGEQKLVSRYATWEAIDDAIRPILAEHGFALSFRSERTDGALTMVAILRHSAGHSTETAGPPVPCDSSGGKNSIQGWGSAMSYGKRYAATAALNIVTEGEDDDAKLAGIQRITNEQIAELQKLIEETGTDERKFAGTFGIQHIGELQRANYIPAKNMLLTKRQKKVAP